MKTKSVVVAIMLFFVNLILYGQAMTMKLNNVTVKEAIAALNKEQGVSIVVETEKIDMNKRVSVSAENTSINEVLSQIFVGQNVDWRVEGNRISVTANTSKVKSQEKKNMVLYVYDENSEPLPGAAVLVKNTKVGFFADTKGRVELTDVNYPVTLQLSYIGCQDAELEIPQFRESMNIYLKSAHDMLDDVVVVGYGTQKRINLTGAVASIDFEKQMSGRAIVNPTASLSGMVSGMNVSQTSGQPGSETTNIRLRGNGTFSSAGSSPLVLVDGVEWSMDNVNPNDIATISVLKDAASTAIYGTRAANGVILITTKNGQKGKANISYSYSGIMQYPYLNLEFVTDYADYMSWVNEAAINVKQSQVFSDATINAWRDAKADPYGKNEYGVPNYVAYPNTDWFSELFHSGYSQEHNVSISGAGEKIKYLVSVNYLDNQGVMNRWNIDSSTQKLGFRTNLEADVTDWFTLGVRLLGQKQSYGLANIGNAFNYLYMTTPGIYPGEPGYWGKPAADQESPSANNIFSHMSGNDGSKNTFRINGTTFAKIRLYKGLVLEGSFNYSPSITLSEQYSRQNGSWDYVKDQRMTESFIENATASKSTSNSFKTTTEVLLKYNTTIKKDHEIGTLLGFSEIYYRNNGSHTTTRIGATDWSLQDLSTYIEMKDAKGSTGSSWGLRSFFGRINYAYKGKYLAEVNLRADGSSRFGSNNKYGFFPSASAAWRLSEEAFLSSSKSWLSNLKLRASWGQTGNNNIGNYAWQATYNTNKVVIEGKPTSGLYIGSLSNNNLSWETTSTIDVGVDYGFFGNRLTGEIDFYSKKTTDILYTPPIYLSMGYVSGVPSNCGEMVNRGVEIALNWNSDVNKKFFYHAGINFSFNTNKVLKFKGKLNKYWEDGVFHNNLSDVTASYGGGLICEDHIIGEYYMLQTYKGSGLGYTGGLVDITAGPKDGIIRTETDFKWVQAMIDSGYSFNGVTQLSKDQLWYGDLIYMDSNGDKNYGNSDDRTFSGTSSQPKYNIGINFGFSCYGVDFNMIWAGAMGFHLNWRTSIYNGTKVTHGHGLIKHIAQDHYFFDPEVPNNPRTNINATYPRLTYQVIGQNGDMSDFYNYKGDYLKLRNVQLGYTLPENISRKFLVSKLRVYVSGDNLLTLTKYPGLDPEIGTSIGYPLMRQVSFGAQVTF